MLKYSYEEKPFTPTPINLLKCLYIYNLSPPLNFSMWDKKIMETLHVVFGPSA